MGTVQATCGHAGEVWQASAPLAASWQEEGTVDRSPDQGQGQHRAEASVISAHSPRGVDHEAGGFTVMSTKVASN